MSSTVTQFTADIMAREQRSQGRFRPVNISFTALTNNGVIGQPLLREIAIHSANAQGWEVEHIIQIAAEG